MLQEQGGISIYTYIYVYIRIYSSCCALDETFMSQIAVVVVTQYVVTKKLGNIGDSAPFCPLLLLIIGQNSLDTGQM